MSTFDMLIKVIPILIAISLGYFLVRTGILKDTMVDAFKKIVVNVTLPAGLFMAFIQIRFKAEYVFIILSIFATNLVLFYIAKLIARVCSIKSKYFPFLLTAFEAGMIGYAVFATVFGTNSAADFGIIDIGSEFFVFFVFVPMLINLNSKEKGWSSAKKAVKAALKTPPIWGTMLGFACSLAGLWAYEGTGAYMALHNILAFVSAPTAFLICIVIGSGLNISMKNMKMEIFTAILKIVLSFIFAFILKYTVLIPLGVTPRVITALFTMFCLPAPFVIPVFMPNPSKEELGYVSNTLSLGSLLGVLCFAAVIFLGL